MSQLNFKEKKATVLVVDDEESILRATKRILRREYNVVTFQNPLEVVDFIENNNIDVLISDEMMPEMRGSDLVSIVHKKNPNICKIILSGHSEKENMARAINQGHIFSFLFKPADNIQLIQAIERGLENKRMREEIINQNEKLSSYNKDLLKMVEERTEQIISMEKFYEVGKFSASIVHNLNNPLQTMIMATQLIEEDFKTNLRPDSVSFKYLRMIDESLITLEKMVKSITLSVRSSAFDRNEEFSLNKIITSVVEYYKIDHSFKHQTNVILDLTSELPLLKGQEIHFNQIISNLVKNSIDAMENSPQKELMLSTRFLDNKITFILQDTGSGIEPKYLDKIFKTGFTTKKPGKGTGLGLSITKQMIESYKGTINVESEIGKGTKFIISLPL